MNAKYNESRFRVLKDSSSSSESISFTAFARALSRSACLQKRVYSLSAQRRCHPEEAVSP